MPASIDKEDLRSIKTEKALNIAMLSLLEDRNFGKITVSDICGEALISRATFYAHFYDKYDLLKNWLKCLKPEGLNIDGPYEQIEKTVNQFVNKNASVIKNLVYDANDETLRILFDSILFNLNFSAHEKTNPKDIVLSNFLAGGILSYLQWQVKNKFPPDAPFMNIHIYEVIEKLREWDA